MTSSNSKKGYKENKRLDHKGTHRTAFERNRKEIIRTQTICAICGKPVNKKLKYPHPMSASCDHIIPLSKGGHPSNIDNLQLAHLYCNRLKNDRLSIDLKKDDEVVSNRNLPHLRDWRLYRG